MNNYSNGSSFIRLHGDSSVIGIQVEKSLMKVFCSFFGCGEQGVAYVDPNSRDTKPHFCILHNPKIIKNTKFALPIPSQIKPEGKIK